MKRSKTIVLCAGLVLFGSSSLLFAQQRSPGGRAQTGVEDAFTRELERALNVNRGGPVNATAIGAWWMDPVLVSRIGLTSDQKARIEKIFDAQRQILTASFMQLERDEIELKRLLESETLDRGAIRAQVDRVIRSRSEMERANANMTLEMREQLSRAQWMELQSQRALVEYFGTIRNRTRSTLPAEERK